MIQKGYHYGCRPGTHETYVYRVTFTNVEGHVFELAWPNVKAFCEKYGLKVVPELYYGKASDLSPYDPKTMSKDVWSSSMLPFLEQTYVDIGMC